MSENKALDAMWDALWEDLRRNATGRPSGLIIVTAHRGAIEKEARTAALAELKREVADWTDYPNHDDDETFADGWRNRKEAALALIADAETGRPARFDGYNPSLDEALNSGDGTYKP